MGRRARRRAVSPLGNPSSGTCCLLWCERICERNAADASVPKRAMPTVNVSSTGNNRHRHDYVADPCRLAHVLVGHLNCFRTQRSPNPRLAAGPSLGFHFQWGSLPSRFPPTSLSCPLG